MGGSSRDNQGVSASREKGGNEGGMDGWELGRVKKVRLMYIHRVAKQYNT